MAIQKQKTQVAAPVKKAATPQQKASSQKKAPAVAAKAKAPEKAKAIATQPAKKVTSAEAKEKKLPLSVRACQLIVAKKSVEDIVTILSKVYPSLKLVNKGTVTYYTRFIRVGKMTSLGFPPESLGEEEPSKTTKEQPAEVAKTQAVTQRKVTATVATTKHPSTKIVK